MMSGECYEPNSCRDKKYAENSGEKQAKLNEYETMVTSAETKCTMLKGQLERIKQLYANQTDLIKSVTKTSRTSLPSTRPLTTDLSKVGTSSSLQSKTKTTPKMVRQNSIQIGTDTTGAALGTINNILAGITKTIEIPELFHQIKELSSKTCQDLGAGGKGDAKQPFGVEEVKINSKSQQTLKTKSSKTKVKRTPSKMLAKNSTVFSKRITNKRSSVKSQDSKLIEGQVRKPGIPLINLKSRKILKRIRAQAKVNTHEMPAESNDLVEIYHNVAIKESKSSETDVPKKRQAEKQPLTMVEEVPPLKIQDEEEIEEIPRAAVEVGCETARNYEMPTVSSRMKKVAKFYMNSFNIKCIPFCTAASVGPSHNIGLNIQQVMSMVKNKQPSMQLSPTLAYNIGLAAGKWENHPIDPHTNPLNSLVSSLTSRIYSTCPLSRSVINYQHLQEVAKTIPERIEEETNDEANEEDDEQMQTVIITGPSGDVRVTNRKQTVWSMDTANDRRCTCVPQKGVEFQQIINKFNGRKMDSRHSAMMPISNKCSRIVSNNGDAPKNAFHNKEQKLKEVLKKLHDEFDVMTKNYEELQLKCQEKGSNDELSKQMEELDKQLTSKEEEIVMVMTLYKEVLALKQQVKTLKDKTSSCSVSVRNYPQQKILVTNSNGGDVAASTTDSNTATAGLLNKLLKQVQHFQTTYKKN